MAQPRLVLAVALVERSHRRCDLCVELGNDALLEAVELTRRTRQGIAEGPHASFARDTFEQLRDQRLESIRRLEQRRTGRPGGRAARRQIAFHGGRDPSTSTGSPDREISQNSVSTICLKARWC